MSWDLQEGIWGRDLLLISTFTVKLYFNDFKTNPFQSLVIPRNKYQICFIRMYSLGVNYWLNYSECWQTKTHKQYERFSKAPSSKLTLINLDSWRKKNSKLYWKHLQKDLELRIQSLRTLKMYWGNLIKMEMKGFPKNSSKLLFSKCWILFLKRIMSGFQSKRVKMITLNEMYKLIKIKKNVCI